MGYGDGGDVRLQFRGRSLSAALQLLAGQLGEPALDLVDPSGRNRREVDMPVRTARQPGLDLRGFGGRNCRSRYAHPGDPASAGRSVRETAKKPAARCRVQHFAIISSVAMSSAAKSEGVPWRLCLWVRLWVRRPAAPGASGRTGCSRCSGWIFDFSSTHNTIARFGDDR